MSPYTKGTVNYIHVSVNWCQYLVVCRRSRINQGSLWTGISLKGISGNFVQAHGHNLGSIITINLLRKPWLCVLHMCQVDNFALNKLPEAPVLTINRLIVISLVFIQIEVTQNIWIIYAKYTDLVFGSLIWPGRQSYTKKSCLRHMHIYLLISRVIMDKHNVQVE